MSTRVVIGGRTAWASRDWRPHRPGTAPLDASGSVVDPRPIPGDEVEARGVPFVDADGLTYRVVERLDISQGWGTIEFWMRRHRVTYAKIREWVEKGWLQGAVERGSPTKRYRCRDERRLLDDMGVDVPGGRPKKKAKGKR